MDVESKSKAWRGFDPMQKEGQVQEPAWHPKQPLDIVLILGWQHVPINLLNTDNGLPILC